GIRDVLVTGVQTCALPIYPPPSGAGDPFAIQAIALGGRVVAAELVDLDGDARADLFCTRIDGMPPDERRTVHVFYQRPDRTFPRSEERRIGKRWRYRLYAR